MFGQATRAFAAHVLVAAGLLVYWLEESAHSDDQLLLAAGAVELCAVLALLLSRAARTLLRAAERTPCDGLCTRLSRSGAGCRENRRYGQAPAQSGFFGAPAQGFGIVGWGGGAGWPFGFRASDCPWSVTATPTSRCAVARSGFGVVASEHDQADMSAGSVVPVFPSTQLFTDCFAPNSPPTSARPA